MGAAKGQRQRNDTLVMQMLGEKVRLLQESAREKQGLQLLRLWWSLRWAPGTDPAWDRSRGGGKENLSQSVVGVWENSELPNKEANKQLIWAEKIA